MTASTLNDIKKIVILLLCCFGAMHLPVAIADTTSLDEVVAVVEKDVIMRSELNSRIAQAHAQLAARNQPAPPDNVLTKQILNNLILESLQLQMADRLGIRVSDEMLNQQMVKIASDNNMTLTQFSEALNREGTNYPAVREQVRREMTIAQLRQRQIGQRIRINDQEVNRALNKQGAVEYHLANIMIRPASNTPEAIANAKKRAMDIYQEAKSGRSFAQLAAAHSSAPNAKGGGDLGWRPLSQLPPGVSSAIAVLGAEDITPPFQDQGGIHIIKVLGKRDVADKNAASNITEYHARHILISPSKIRSDAQAQKLINEIKQEIDKGVDFAKLAQKYSDDPSSASQGGDLGWSTAKKFVPEFAQQLETLPEKKVSAPFRTKFGWHILEVLESKKQAVVNEQEEAARASLRKQKYDEELEKWLRQIRQEAFVDIKIDAK
jgi:peptidyl-prolyl cis-trans isomerase SurA